MEKLSKALEQVIRRWPRWSLLLFAILAYWPISFLQYSVKWDMLDTVWPWRYFIGESLRAGQFPFWNAFQQLGYPIHADVRSVWNPEELITSYLFGPDLYSLQWILVGYFALGGIGMFQLLKRLNVQDLNAWTVAVVYMICGYMVGQAQDMPRIAAAALLPWSVWAWWGMKLFPGKVKPALIFAIWMYFQLSSGYQAIAIILNYLFLILFLVEIYLVYKKAKTNEIWQNVKSHLIGYSVLVFLSLPMLYSIWESSEYVGRFDSGVTESQALNHPFSPASFLSFISSWAVNTADPIFQTDVSMRNAFFGIIGLILFITGLLNWKKMSLELKAFSVFGIACILPALGHFTPVRMWMYDYIPLMNLFKTPAYFILFFLFVSIVIAAIQLEKITKKHLRFLPILLALVSILIYLLSDRSLNWNHIDPREALLSRIAIQLGISAILFVPLIFQLDIRWWRIIWIAEMLVALQLNLTETAVDEVSPLSKQEYFQSLPRGFKPQPQLNLKEQTETKLAFIDIYRNNGVFQKRISPAGFNSFYFDALNQLEADSSKYAYWLKHPPAFVESLNGLDSNFQWSINWKKIEANQIALEVDLNQKGRLNLVQSSYPGWRLFIDGQEATMSDCNNMFMCIDLNPNKHTVKLKYENEPLIFLMILSGIALLLLGSWYFISSNGWTISFVLVTGLLLITWLSRSVYSNRQARQEEFWQSLETYQNILPFIGISEDESDELKKGLNPFGAPWEGDLAEWDSCFTSLEADSLLFVQTSERRRSALWSMLHYYYPNSIDSNSNGRMRWAAVYRESPKSIHWETIEANDQEFISLYDNTLAEGDHSLILKWESDSALSASLRWVAEFPKTKLWYGLPSDKGPLQLDLKDHPEGALRVYLWNPEHIPLKGLRYQLKVY